MNKRYLSWCVSFLALTALLTADDATIDPSHGIVDSRPLSAEEKALIEQARALEEFEQEGATILQENIYRNSKKADQNAKILLTNGFFIPLNHHWIDQFPSTNVIKLEDGSEWTVGQKEAYAIRFWKQGDPVVITRNHSWFPQGNYCLTNKNRNDAYAQVTLSLGPTLSGLYTHWVIGMDFSLGQVHLTNGKGERTTWHISHNDAALFKKWQINDNVIIGINDGWGASFSAFDHILINVPVNHNVRAKQF
jgi:hypothetical protein